jgi:lactose/L-arabinose transport system ATP-binding protein
VDFYEYLGGTQFLYCQLEDGQAVTAEYRSSVPVQGGDILHFRWKTEDLRFFDAAGLRLRLVDPHTAQMAQTSGQQAP